MKAMFSLPLSLHTVNQAPDSILLAALRPCSPRVFGVADECARARLAAETPSLEIRKINKVESVMIEAGFK